jgi:hypothetical protein
VKVVDCRICGDPHSVLRFAFVEFADERKIFLVSKSSVTCHHYSILHVTMDFYLTDGARAALNLGGTMLGYYPVRVLPSKTAILPVNPTFLPRVSITL